MRMNRYHRAVGDSDCVEYDFSGEEEKIREAALALAYYTLTWAAGFVIKICWP